MYKIKVTGDRVLIKQYQSEKQVSGIIVPDNIDYQRHTGLQKHVNTGKILSLGEECYFGKEGDEIFFGKDDAATIDHEGEKYTILRESSVLFTFNEDTILRVNKDRVILKAIPKEKLTLSGIIIPDNVSQPTVSGKVLFIGETCKVVSAEQTILFGQAAGVPIQFKGEDYHILRESDVVGIIN